jgi:hypothetical protein
MALYRTAPARDWASAYMDMLAAHGGAIPPKSSLDVTAMRSVVPHLVLCAVTLPDKCIYRVVGEEVKLRVGRSMVGLNYYDLVPAERRASAMHTMRMVIEAPCGFRVEMEQSYGNGLSRLVEGAAFPLASAEPGADGFVLIADCEIAQGGGKALHASIQPGTTLLGTHIRRRDLIDIGFGVDETFVDMVPAGDSMDS